LAEEYSATRCRIHEKAHKYFFFQRLPQKEKNKFFGATDALWNTNIDESAYSDGIKNAPGSYLLLCYGFLQALYVQQDAVTTLSKALGIDWKAESDSKLIHIRDIRDRLCGHPALRDRSHKVSSAIIIRHEISETGFAGAIYYDDGFKKVTVDVPEFLRINQEQLLVQMTKIEAAMDEKERDFRKKQSEKRFAGCFEGSFTYLRQRLICDLQDDARRIQAEIHSRKIIEVLHGLQDGLRSEGFADRADSSTFRTAVYGINLLRDIISSSDTSCDAQDRFDLLYVGVDKYLDEIIRDTCELDEALSAPIQ